MKHHVNSISHMQQRLHCWAHTTWHSHMQELSMGYPNTQRAFHCHPLQHWQLFPHQQMGQPHPTDQSYPEATLSIQCSSHDIIICLPPWSFQLWQNATWATWLCSAVSCQTQTLLNMVQNSMDGWYIGTSPNTAHTSSLSRLWFPASWTPSILNTKALGNPKTPANAIVKVIHDLMYALKEQKNYKSNKHEFHHYTPEHSQTTTSTQSKWDHPCSSLSKDRIPWHGATLHDLKVDTPLSQSLPTPMIEEYPWYLLHLMHPKVMYRRLQVMLEFMM